MKLTQMNIHISDDVTIKGIQKEFSSLFPYLKLEFFSRPHQTGKGSEKKYMETEDALLKDFRLVHSEGDLIIEGDMTVSNLEDLFKIHFGLYVQVFRRSGKLWLETTATDSWTLSVQNEQGAELSNDYKD
jgi:hypothetical protein